MGILKDRRLAYERQQLGLALAELLVEGDNITLEHNVGDGTVTINGMAGGETGGLTTNQVKDIVGAMGVDTATIDWTYDGTARTFSFAVKNSSITTGMLAFDPATQAELQAVIDSVTTVSGAAASAASAAAAAQATADTAVANAATAAAAAATAQNAANAAQATANTGVTNAATAQAAADTANAALVPASLVNLFAGAGAATVDVNAGKVRITVPAGLTQEQVEDFVAAMFPDDSMWDYTYTDNGAGAGTVSFVPKDGTIAAAKLSFDVATQVELDAVQARVAVTRIAADVTNLTTTPADTIVSGTLQPGTYKFTVDGTWSSSSTTAGLRVAFHFDGTASALNYQAFIGTSSTAIRCESTTVDGATLGGATSATANAPYPFQLRGTIVVTAAGVLHFQHAGSSAVTLKVLTGTELTVTKV